LQKEKRPGFGAFRSVYELELEFGYQGLRAGHFLVGVLGVASCFHPGCEEEAAFLGFGVVRKRAVALFGQAFLAFGVGVTVVADFIFTVAEESAVSCAVLRDVPAHLAASVKGAESATRNHDIELTALHVITDVRCHHDEGLALEHFVVLFGFVLALTVEGEGEAFAAGCVVARSCREGVGELVAYDYRNLACASGALAARADASAVVANRSFALGVASLGGTTMFRPGAVRHAAVPVTGCKSWLAACTGIEVFGFFGRNVATVLRIAGLGLAARRRRAVRRLCGRA